MDEILTQLAITMSFGPEVRIERSLFVAPGMTYTTDVKPFWGGEDDQLITTRVLMSYKDYGKLAESVMETVTGGLP